MLAHWAGHGLRGFTPSSLLHSLEMCDNSSKRSPRVPPHPPTQSIPWAVPALAFPSARRPGPGSGAGFATWQGLSLCPDPGLVSDKAIKLCWFRELTVQTFWDPAAEENRHPRASPEDTYL